jgi:ribosome-associated protein
MLNSNSIKEYIERNAEFSFSRSGGPGGQNVNKVNTKVTVRLPISDMDFFSEKEIKKLNNRLGNRINSEGDLVLQVREERSQKKNREIAERRLLSLLQGALKERKKRKSTKPSRSAKERRLQEKKHRSEIKKKRGAVHLSEE